jgi:prepilin-type processing-associated H-X9-DG protein
VYLTTAPPPDIAKQLYDPDQAVRYCSSLSLSLPQESRGGESWFLSGLHFTNYNHCAPPNMKILDCSLNANDLKYIFIRVNEQGIFKASSYHPGGVNAGLLDGSVRFFTNGVDLRLCFWFFLGGCQPSGRLENGSASPAYSRWPADVGDHSPFIASHLGSTGDAWAW